MRQRMRLVILGDSVTAGYGLERLPSERPYPDLVAQRLARKGLAIEMMVSALDGIDSAYALRRFGRLVAMHEPDWVLVMLGLNDAQPPGGRPPVGAEEFGGHIEELVDRIHQIDSRAVLVSPNPRRRPQREGWGSDLMREYVKMLGTVADQRRVGWIDAHRQFAAEPDWAGLVPDGVHPSAAGHRLIAEVVSEELVWLLSQADRRPAVAATARLSSCLAANRR